MTGWRMFKPEAALAVRCPRCGARPQEKCKDGGTPHKQRRIALFEERRAKPVTRTLHGKTFHT